MRVDPFHDGSSRREAERQPGVVFDVFGDVEFGAPGSVPLRGEGERVARGLGQGQVGMESVLDVLGSAGGL